MTVVLTRRSTPEADMRIEEKQGLEIVWRKHHKRFARPLLLGGRGRVAGGLVISEQIVT